VAASLAEIDGRPAVFAFIFDRSERHAAEEERRRNEARFRELIENAPEPIGIVRDGRFVYANRVYATTLGIDDVEVLYRTPIDTLLDPESAVIRDKREWTILNRREPQAWQMYRAHKPDGSPVILEVSSVYFEYQGKPSVLTMARDATLRTHLENQVVQADRLAALGTMAAGVAHEINNPLASIAFCAEALDQRLERVLSARDHPDHRVVANYLKMIQEEAFRCKNITEKLLDFSRCNDIKRERIDLASLIQGVVEMIRHIGKYTGKSIIFHPREAVMAHVDGQEIKQVVLNLIVNALESMNASGSLRIDARYNQGMAEMIFTDNGCGMSPEVLENIFEPFFTRRRDGKGTGLGLSITHRIVNQHHGDIMAFSPGEDQGSTFVVRLPIHPTEIAEDGLFSSKNLGRRRTEPVEAVPL
jgi:PAS domain S-box-containing protein